MIEQFTVSNFYSIREAQTLSFIPSRDDSMKEYYTHEICSDVRLLKIGIVYGSNASGKSNMLMALDYFKHLMTERPSSRAETLEFLPFLLDKNSRDEHSKMEMSFYLNAERYLLSVEFDSKRIYHEALKVYENRRPSIIYTRIYDNDKDQSIVSFGQKAHLKKSSQKTITGITINNCCVLAAFGQSNVEISRLNDVYNYFIHGIQNRLQPQMSMINYVKKRLKNDQNNEIKQFILKVLKASDFNITDFTLEEAETSLPADVEKAIKRREINDAITQAHTENLSFTNNLLFTHSVDNGNFPLNESVESQGTKRFMGMAMFLYELIKQNKTILIDEAESSIHYELLAYFIKLFLANSHGTAQLLITTHDINLLDEDFIRRDIIWFTDKDESGVTKLNRLSGLGLHKTLSPYNAYRQGKLSNLPFLGSIFLN